MRSTLFLLAVLACSDGSACAEPSPCVEIQSQLSVVAKYLAQGDSAAADQALGNLDETYPDCPEAILNRARLLSLKGDASAEDVFVHYNNLKLRDARGYAYYARFLLDQGEYQRADAVSMMATDYDPDEPVGMAVRGQLKAMKGNTLDGIHLLEQACKVNPDDEEARFQLGSIYDRSRHPKQAIEHFTEALKISSLDARAWDYLALNLEPLGEEDRAMDAYKHGLAVNLPGSHFDAFLPYNYGRFLMKHNDLSGSKEQLDKAVELTAQVRAPWYERARLNLRLKNYPQARHDAEKALALEDPQGVIVDLQVYALLEQIYSRLGEAELAHKYAELGRVTPPPLPDDTDSR